MLAGYLNPDGKFSDRDRQRKRGFTVEQAGLDHMAKGKLVADPELQALLDLVLAKHGAPGADLPDGQLDLRSAAQRRHDAFKTALAGYTESGAMGSHRGIPATIVVTASLTELQQAAIDTAAGLAPTGFG